MRRRRFWKLSAAGNDFILILDRPRLHLAPLARRLCDRRLGVGADGLLAARRIPSGIRVRYANADGSRAFCGNGLRAAAWWAFARGWGGRSLRLSTDQGVCSVRILSRRRAAVAMPEARVLRWGLPLRAAGRDFIAHLLDTGVPHAVIPLGNIGSIDMEKFGAAIRSHRAFGAAGANVDFICRDGRGLALRTFERGVEAETLACGTGAVAAAAVAHRLGWVKSSVRVRARGGVMSVDFRHGETWLEGPVLQVLEGYQDGVGGVHVP